LALGDDYIESAQLAGELDKLTKANKEERIFLRADEEVDYGDLMGVMNQLRTAGYLKIALVGLDDLGASKAQP
jgi:biopolymer transport protein ExbD